MNPVLPALLAGAASWVAAPPRAGRLEALMGRPSIRTLSSIARRRRPGKYDHLRALVVLLEAVAGELETGAELPRALVVAADGVREPLASAVAVIRGAIEQGEDATIALAQLAEQEIADLAMPLAACCSVAVHTGGGAAASVRAVAAALREEQRARDVVAAELAGPRASAHLLAALPGVGLLLATVLGARPWAFLFTTPAGLGCLFGAGLLDVAGWCWTARIARGVAG